ncbi:hypothetical protein AG1IA_05036 [Rhizoctonia solani AG-1 IA]|uniref:Uncharacterized protein n=1 Tax=Thanatephorus cucumeris (strain AG1-IA) TaxID=983506 RepID=L8WS35_THACA|nr:hypothetical protein AG1IA_05036 [Rhizoctonia solani AG-1 IA]
MTMALFSRQEQNSFPNSVTAVLLGRGCVAVVRAVPRMHIHDNQGHSLRVCVTSVTTSVGWSSCSGFTTILVAMERIQSAPHDSADHGANHPLTQTQRETHFGQRYTAGPKLKGCLSNFLFETFSVRMSQAVHNLDHSGNNTLISPLRLPNRLWAPVPRGRFHGGTWSTELIRATFKVGAVLELNASF